MLSRLYGVLLPFFVSLLLAYILEPIVLFFQNKCRIRNRAAAVLVTLLLAITVLTGLGIALSKPIKAQVNTAWEGFEHFVANFDINDYIPEETQEKYLGQKIDLNLETIVNDPQVQQTVRDIIPTIVNWITGGLSWLTELVVIFIGFMYLIFLMMDYPNLGRRFTHLVPKKYQPKVAILLEDLDHNMNAYFRGQALIALCVGILFALGFWIIGMPMGIAMGLIIGVLNLVPYMQALGIPPCIILCFIQSAQTGRPLWLTLLLMTLVFVVVQSIQDLILTPGIMGKATGLRPAFILLSLTLWGAFFGIIGMIVALPMTTLILSYYKRFIAKKDTSDKASLTNYRGKLRTLSLCALIALPSVMQATVYQGVVLDEKAEPIPYATVYPEDKPELGTATNNAGQFTFKADLAERSYIIVSFVGYEKVRVPQKNLIGNPSSLQQIVLHEQPIALEETVVTAKPSKQRNKRKQRAALLHAVYSKLEEEFPDENTQYQVVSDVQMQSEGNTWGMEQMIANIVVLPEAGHEGRDSLQFQGRFCKRFFDARKRAQADSIMASDMLERMEKQAKMPEESPKNLMRRAMNAVDSGVVVHRALFALGNMRFDFQESMGDIKHWTVSNESEGETVLTHTQKVNKYMGCFKVIFKRHYIVDSETYAVRRFSEHADIKVTIPFGYKLSAEQLQMLNLFNMSEKHINRFRLKKMKATIDLNTIYQRKDGHVYILEKNMVSNGTIEGSHKMTIPINLKATQRVTGLQTKGVKPLKKSQITYRLKRQNVEIY